MKNYYATKKYEILSKLKEDSVNYIFISDIHYMGISTGQGAVLLEQIKQAVDLANECENIDLLVLGGDTVQGYWEDKKDCFEAYREILSALDVTENKGMDIVSCPTCGRTKINLISLSEEFERRARLEGLDKKNIKVALMGCAVNGPGEAREADIGIAGGIGEGLLFKKGEIIRKIKEDRLIDELIEEIKLL